MEGLAFHLSGPVALQLSTSPLEHSPLRGENPCFKKTLRPWRGTLIVIFLAKSCDLGRARISDPPKSPLKSGPVCRGPGVRGDIRHLATGPVALQLSTSHLPPFVIFLAGSCDLGRARISDPPKSPLKSGPACCGPGVRDDIRHLATGPVALQLSTSHRALRTSPPLRGEIHLTRWLSKTPFIPEKTKYS